MRNIGQKENLNKENEMYWPKGSNDAQPQRKVKQMITGLWGSGVSEAAPALKEMAVQITSKLASNLCERKVSQES
eukprot:1161090-Pelagomonas_calceolata.AAC.10